MPRFYNGFVVEGQLTADQKRTLSMTKRTLERKGIRFGNVTKVSEPIAPIETRDYTGMRASVKQGIKVVPIKADKRLTVEETIAYNASLKPATTTERGFTDEEVAEAKARLLASLGKGSTPRRRRSTKARTGKGSCFWGSPSCKNKRWGKVGQKWHMSCAAGREYAAEQLLKTI